MRLLKLIGIIAAFALLIAVILRFDPAEIAANLASADPVPVITALILMQMQIVVSALRWRFTAARLGQQLGIGQAIGDYYLGALLNQLLPGGMAGDGVRALRNRMEEAGGWKVPTQAIFFERLAGQGVFFLVAVFGVMLWPFVDRSSVPPELRHILAGFSLLVTALMLAAILIFRFPPGILRRKIETLRTAMSDVFLRDRAWMVQITFSLVIVASYIVVFLLASAAIGAPLPMLAAITAIPLCLLMMLMPATIAGWGAREAAAAAVWPLFGYSASDGIAASILYGILALVGAAPGLVFVMAALLRPNHR